jgi:hypothetical protein
MSWHLWTADDRLILRRVYPVTGMPGAMAALPGRSEDAIRRQVSLLKIPHPNTWLPEQDKILRDVYPEEGPSAVQALIPHRSIKSIYQRAAKIGCFRTNATAGRWPAGGVPDVDA